LHTNIDIINHLYVANRAQDDNTGPPMISGQLREPISQQRTM
jgi:hypothetical protein